MRSYITDISSKDKGPHWKIIGKEFNCKLMSIVLKTYKHLPLVLDRQTDVSNVHQKSKWVRAGCWIFSGDGSTHSSLAVRHSPWPYPELNSNHNLKTYKYKNTNTHTNTHFLSSLVLNDHADCALSICPLPLSFLPPSLIISSGWQRLGELVTSRTSYLYDEAQRVCCHVVLLWE